VAERAGVGIGTVSRVLNDSAGVAEATRVRVRAVMDELGYRPARPRATCRSDGTRRWA
jgi:LacI family transcriptional regulator